MSYIKLANISLDLPIYDSSRSFRSSFLKPLFLGGKLHKSAGSRLVSVTALSNVNLEFKKGARVGLLGTNGAGKSSLLRLIAQIYDPTQGEMTISGRVSSLFNIGFGMDGNSTGHENIEYICKLRGMSSKEINQRYDTICEFSELGDYLDLPLKTYSLGMQSRLAFSIVSSLEPDILLLDETFGVGDKRFIAKAQAQVEKLIEKSGILLFASHSEELLKRACNQLLWLERGEVQMFGAVDEVLAAYSERTDRSDVS